MSITVRYFASLKDAVGRREDALSTDAPLTVDAIWQRLNPDIAPPPSILAAVNLEYVGWDALVRDGDEVAFFPPVTGG